MKIGLSELSPLVDNQMQAISTLGEYIMLQRGGTIVRVDYVTRLVVDLTNPISKLRGVWNGSRKKDESDPVREPMNANIQKKKLGLEIMVLRSSFQFAVV